MVWGTFLSISIYGQFLGLGGGVGWGVQNACQAVHFLAHFDNVKKQALFFAMGHPLPDEIVFYLNT